MKVTLPIELWQMRAFEIKQYLQRSGIVNEMVYKTSNLSPNYILNGDFEFLACKLYTNVQQTTMVLAFS